ncbi:DZR domain protein [Natronomonas moolapensis 8.8.11]|uniref:DZR domain protein n=1 Tax=Natronomonas moolapensis (strain DSM 18674 / CECT 7526 / JCM 14361 / 8.8.11) TaxID=268739 RepID=M1XU61_NATM8|nr:zinc ribbon domain-containing protein [Natronomonas moolapensis]CCQ38016.1 DZR domain protein [Natronomonas moolapensis 8.8.11]
MSKITFRADDELVRRLEEFDASKSEVMREALRTYLETTGSAGVNAPDGGDSGGSDASIASELLDELVAERVDALIAERLDRAYTPRQPQDVNVHVTLDGDSDDVSHESEDGRKTPTVEQEDVPDESGHTCKQCGETLPQSAVYCSNCGEKSSHRVFCECGDELRSDWGFCPSCGRRTPAADVLQDS